VVAVELGVKRGRRSRPQWPLQPQRGRSQDRAATEQSEGSGAPSKARAALTPRPSEGSLLRNNAQHEPPSIRGELVLVASVWSTVVLLEVVRLVVVCVLVSCWLFYPRDARR
jgi:hypothetical protein